MHTVRTSCKNRLYNTGSQFVLWKMNISFFHFNVKAKIYKIFLFECVAINSAVWKATAACECDFQNMYFASCELALVCHVAQNTQLVNSVSYLYRMLVLEPQLLRTCNCYACQNKPRVQNHYY